MHESPGRKVCNFTMAGHRSVDKLVLRLVLVLLGLPLLLLLLLLLRLLLRALLLRLRLRLGRRLDRPRLLELGLRLRLELLLGLLHRHRMRLRGRLRLGRDGCRLRLRPGRLELLLRHSLARRLLRLRLDLGCGGGLRRRLRALRGRLRQAVEVGHHRRRTIAGSGRAGAGGHVLMDRLAAREGA